MKDLPNIEKSAFRKGEYVGYGAGKVWRIRKSTSSYGNWLAISQHEPNRQVFAWRLADMSDNLSALNTTLARTMY